MTSLNDEYFARIAQKFSHYFHSGVLTSSYKPVLLKAIIHLLKKKHVKQLNGIYYIPMEDIAEYFFRFNIVLYKRFNLKQLNSKNRNVKIYGIIDEHFASDPGIKVPKEIPKDTIEKIIYLLHRNVIYLLRRDLQVFNFYDANLNLIGLKYDIKNEQEFKALINRKHICYIGLSVLIVKFIVLNRPVLEAAVLANLAIFLEGINNVPNLNAKIRIADGTYRGIRNISDQDKKKLYAYQNKRCFYCGCDMNENPEADHFVPYNYLLDSEIWNIVAACQQCNSKKSNYLVEEPEYLEVLFERNITPEFISLFHADIEQAKSIALEKNKLLQQHYSNCKLYFRIISMKS